MNIFTMLMMLACGDESANTDGKQQAEKQVVSEKKSQSEKGKQEETVETIDYTPKMDMLKGPKRPALLVSQAWFHQTKSKKPIPGPARLEIWRQDDKGTWEKTTVEDPDSNVFHKAIPYEDGILTIGAEKAILKKWTFDSSAKSWKQDVLWERAWKGKFNRLRDIEVGDVDHDGKDELVIATHDAGVVAVLHPDEKYRVEELDEKADTFVHEIEIGDIDGDGKLEFFATPTDRNKAGASQGGLMVMYQYDGTTFKRTVVDPFGKTHAKEILAADITGDKTAELFSVVEAEAIGKTIVKPVQIRQYKRDEQQNFQYDIIATLQDRQTRFLVSGDFDQDGTIELVAAAMKSGLWLLDPQKDGSFATTLIEKNSSGFEHTTYGADLDGDGKLELYVAADEQGELNQYVWNGSGFTKNKIGDIPKRTFTWNITVGQF